MVEDVYLRCFLSRQSCWA